MFASFSILLFELPAIGQLAVLMFVGKPNNLFIYLAGQNHSANNNKGAFVFQLQSPVKLHSGKNYVSLLSGTVGLKVSKISAIVRHYY